MRGKLHDFNPNSSPSPSPNPEPPQPYNPNPNPRSASSAATAPRVRSHRPHAKQAVSATGPVWRPCTAATFVSLGAPARSVPSNQRHAHLAVSRRWRDTSRCKLAPCQRPISQPARCASLASSRSSRDRWSARRARRAVTAAPSLARPLRRHALPATLMQEPSPNPGTLTLTQTLTPTQTRT